MKNETCEFQTEEIEIYDENDFESPKLFKIEQI